MLARARDRGHQVLQGSATALPFADATFGCVYSFKVLAHIPAIDTALSEIARVLRPGGHAVLELYNRWSLRYLARLAAGARKIGAHHDEADIPTRWDSPKEAIERLPASLELVQDGRTALQMGVKPDEAGKLVYRIDPELDDALFARPD